MTDSEKMSKFYSELFDWKFAKQDMPGMDYWMIETTGPGTTELNGGMYPKMGNESDKPRFYVGVEDIDKHTLQFRDAGGVVLQEKQMVPGFGWAVIGSDPEGNILGLFQPLQPMPQPARKRPASSARRKTSSSSSKSKKKKTASRKRKR